MINTYEGDVVAWANEQAALLRSGRLSELDIENIAEEILDVGKSEQRELASRMVVLLAHLLKWQYQPERRGKSWELTIKTQRKAISSAVKKMPSLKAMLSDSEWWEVVWGDAFRSATNETGLENIFPDVCPWQLSEILNSDYFPNN